MRPGICIIEVSFSFSRAEATVADLEAWPGVEAPVPFLQREKKLITC